MELLQRSSPRNIYSQVSSAVLSPRSYSSLRPLSPDALELKRENEELKKLVYQLNIKLKYEQDKSRRLEYRELLRKELKSNVLSIRDPIKRRQMIHDVNEDEIREGREPIMGTITEDNLVEYALRGGGKKKKHTKKRKPTKKKKPTKNKKKTMSKDKIKKACKSECIKSQTLLPIFMKKLGKDQKFINEKLKEHKKECEPNCTKLLSDKDLMKNILNNR